MIIAVTNRKGGVGKSTMAVHLAAGLATVGYRVGLVDTDSQGHSGMMLGRAEDDGLYRLLVEKAALETVAAEIAAEGYATADHPALGSLWLIQSGMKTHKIPHLLESHETFLFLDRMREFEQRYALDVILLDTSPTLSLFDGALFLAADGFVYVTECEQLSFDGVQAAMNQMANFGQARLKYLGRESRVLGIIPNKLRAGTYLHRHNIKQLTAVYGELVWPPVTLRTVWTEATNVGELVYTFAPTGQEAADAWDKVERVRKAMEAWATAETR